MKKYLAYLLLTVLTISCSLIDTEDDGHGISMEEVPVMLNVFASELEMDEPDSKAANPLDPVVENTFTNLWLLQYGEDNRLIQSDTVLLDHPVLGTKLEVKLKKSQNSTLVVIANMLNTHGDDPEWPSSGAFKWGEHGGGSLYDLRNKLFACSLKAADQDHLFMTGITNLDIDDSAVENGISVDLMLSRLASKFNVTIKSATPNKYSNVRIQMINCPTKMSLFPDEISLTPPSDLEEYDAQQVCGVGEYLGTDASKSYYFYANENLCSARDKQIKLRINADKEGTPVQKDLSVSSDGSTYRNTYYHIHITLK